MSVSEVQSQPRNDTQFAKASGMQYLGFLEEMHKAILPDWYLEVGTQTGASLAKSKTKSVSVDPQFVLKHDVWRDKPELHLFQTTSDDFFAQGHLDRLNATFNLAFLDGMHLYEFLLRDFINAERYMAPDGHIVLHDCLPWSENMALRDRRQVNQRAWTGDVWKIVPILQQYRPDLKISIYDAAPTGLVVVSNLDPKSRALVDNYDAIIAAFDSNDDLAGYLAELDVTATRQSTWHVAHERLQGQLHFAIKSNVPRPGVQNRWGDYHFAVGLQNALIRLGHTASIRTRKHWHIVEDDNEIDLVISGHTPHQKRDGHLSLQWMISSGAVDHADHTFVASEPLLQLLLDADEGASMSLMPQSFDADRMPLPDLDAPRSGVLFVGIARNGRRPLVSYALASGTALDLWGPCWEDTEAAQYHLGAQLDNTQLGAHYAKAEVVLNDHTRVMRRNGLTSNRIFDALACGTPVISDPVSWLPDEMREFVDVASSPEEFAEALARIRAETAEKRKARYDFALKMRQDHSFDARASEILRVVKEHLG